MQRFAPLRARTLTAAFALNCALLSGCSSSDGDNSSGGSANGGSANGGNSNGGNSNGGSSNGGTSNGGTSNGGALPSTGGTAAGGAGGNAGAGTSSSVSGNAGAAGSASGSTGAAGGPAVVDCGTKTDACPFAAGLSAACEKRFGLGVNYAWHNFGGDFGGLAQWSIKGVSQDAAAVATDLDKMAMNGVSVIRWWMFPDFRGDGVQFDANGDPSGLSPEVAADIDKALELAEARNLYLVFTIFSFDNFRPDKTDSGVMIRGMSPMVSSAARRAKLIANIVKPAAHAAATSRHANHLLGWDVINEPEWAITATNSNPQDFSPNTELTAVSLADMKSLITESLAALKTETPTALRSVGWAAAKWSWAFNDITDLEFNQPHIYGWVDKYWPYTTAPTALGYPPRPTVYGEFFLQSMPFVDASNTTDVATYDTILTSWYMSGYAGAWGWDFSSASASLPLIKAFSEAKGCTVKF
jgi:hypothetical protein